MIAFRGMPVRCALIGLFTSALPCSVPVNAQVEPVRNSQHRSPDFDDLLTLRTFSELAVSNDGRWAAFVRHAPFNAPSVKQTDSITFLDLHTRVSHAVAAKGAPRQLQWSPSGDTLAFLAESEGRARLWLSMPTERAARPFTLQDSLAGRLVSFTWSPTGNALAYLASAPTDGGAARDSAQPTPRLVIFRDSPGSFTGPLSPSYRSDSAGVYLATVAIGGGPADVLGRHVVSSKYDPKLDWSSESILVGGAPLGASWWPQLTKRALHLFDRTGGRQRKLPTLDVETWHPSLSPSAQLVAYIAYQVYPEDDRQLQRMVLQVMNLDGDVDTRTMSHENDGLTLEHAPIWAGDSAVYITRDQKGSARLFRANVATKRWDALTPDTLSVAQFAVSNDGKTILAILESANAPQELYDVDPATGALTKLTAYGDSIRTPTRGRVRQLAWPSGDGRFTVHGFLVEPPAYDSTRAYPLVVLVNGGPGALFTNTFILANYWQQGLVPPQWLAAAGYLVLLPNPRGDRGFGEEYAGANRGDYGFGPLGDVEGGVSMLIARGLVDSTEVGIAGVSFGGYLTALAVTHTTRFTAASIDDGPTDLRLDYGENYALRAEYWRTFFGGTPWDMPGVYAAQSPITHVDRVRTPVLMRYGGRGSTSDEIRPSYMLAQGLEFYAGLRDAGVPVEFILHPDQGHGVGDWELYKDWVTRNVRWFDYWLLKEGERPPATFP